MIQEIKEILDTLSEFIIKCENREHILLNQQINVYDDKNRLIISYLESDLLVI